jgi:AP2 domain/HNH endonuclease
VREIPLHGIHAQGRVALIDDEDYDLVAPHRWHVNRIATSRRLPYAITDVPAIGLRRSYTSMSMHKLITGYRMTDHINRNTLDNRRSNLREVTSSQNQMNAKSRGGVSQFKGVRWRKDRSKWVAIITVDYKKKRVGSFDNEIDAARAYDNAALELFGEYALLNFPDGR